MVENERCSATTSTNTSRAWSIGRTRGTRRTTGLRKPDRREDEKRCRGFEELFEAVLERAYAAANYMTRDPADAEDLLQEAALQAFTRFGTFEPGTNFKAWFLKILTNCFYMRHRRRQREPMTTPLDDAPDLYLYSATKNAGLHDGEPDPAHTFMNKLETEQVGDAIRALPEEFQMVATLYFIDDMSYQDIATILNCPVGTVRSRLHRGRRLLQVALWHIAEDHGLVSKNS